MQLRSFRNWVVLTALVVMVVVTAVMAAVEPAGAYVLKAKMVSTVLADRRGVSVEVSGGGLASPVTKLTNDLGIAKFTGLAAGTYTVIPTKNGYRYTPAQKVVTFSGAVLTQTASFIPTRLPAVGSVTVDKTALAFVASAGPIENSQVVVVTVKTALGAPVKFAPVNVLVADPAIATVTPLFRLTNKMGQMYFIITAGDTAGATTITFSSGAWRGATAKTATTDVTVDAGFPEAVGWVGSGHADATGGPFTHWDSTGSIPTTCAKCHSRPGFWDFLGIDGTAVGVVDNAAPIGTTVDCFVCHNDASGAWDTVTFPSGKEVTGIGAEAFCLECHQGTSSAPAVDTALSGKPDDTVDATLSFLSAHYFTAAATQYGAQAQGAYEYPGQIYTWKFLHVNEADTCITCHNEHSLAVKLDVCATCHAGATTLAALEDIRMAASIHDYDGDGNTTEGIYFEVKGLADALYAGIQQYATGVALQAIVYDGATYPYFFKDTNGNGVVDPGENVYGNKYASWTPRLARAAYNYQWYIKDPGAFAHNAKYMIEVLYDSLADLAIAVPAIDMTGMVRDDSGHFDPTSMAFRDWDADVGGVSASCSRCHSGEGGFDYYISNGFTNPTARQPVVGKMSCETCHTGFTTTTAPRKYVSQVIFPGDAANANPLYTATRIYNSTSSPDDSFICMTCHQGRQSNATVRKTLGTKPVDTIDATLSPANVHYAAAGATLYGTTAKVGYEYSTELGATYVNFFKHANASTAAKCSSCHGVTAASHEFFPSISATCAICHTETVAGADLSTIRKNRATDYNGNGDTAESLKAELDPIAAAVLVAIQAEATANGFGLDFEPVERRWYEAGTTTTYAHWTPRMVKAAFNYNYYLREAGAWAHNTDYMAQLLYDSIEDVGGDASAFNVPGRPLP